jgi:hypothetical protein
VSDDRYASAPEVAGEVIGGEAIVINLETGIYYSLDRAGASIWELLTSGYDAAETAEMLASAYGVPVERARDDTVGLAEELVREGLLLVRTGGNRDLKPVVLAEPARSYEAPRLERYTDMGDLFALDPPTPGLADIPWRLPDSSADDS